jgi:hypothetical protein
VKRRHNKIGNVARVVTRVKMSEQTNDFAYWQTRSYAERISTLQELRYAYMRWKYGSVPRFQSVSRVIKQNYG